MGEVSPPFGARVHFLCLPKENEPKERAPRQMRPTGSLRGSGGSLTGPPWPDSELADVLSATLRAFSSTPPPHLKGAQWRAAPPASRTMLAWTFARLASIQRRQAGDAGVDGRQVRMRARQDAREVEARGIATRLPEGLVTVADRKSTR